MSKAKTYSFDRLLVALDTSELDELLIKTAWLLADASGARKVYFLHVARSLELPKEIAEKFPDLLAPADETVERVIEDKVKAVFPDRAELDIEVEVLEGDPAQMLLKHLKSKHIDLCITGRKLNLKGAGAIPSKLSKVAPCSVMFVPESMPQNINKILVPIDFSDFSEFAMEKALLLAREQNASLLLHHVYELPTGYHTSGKSEEEFSEIMRSHAEKHCDHFVKKFDTSGVAVDAAFDLNNDSNPADEIYNQALNQKAQLVVVGSKGRKGLSSILLGSVASKILDYGKTIPVMVVKKKGEGLSFLEALLKL